MHCHCSMCRKIHGAAFGTYAAVAWKEFRFTCGETVVASYRSTSAVTRTFCSKCGSTLQFIRDGRGSFSLAVGTLDSDPGRRATRQIWTKDKAPWWDLTEKP